MMSYHKINVHVLCSLRCLRLLAYISGTMVCTVLYGSMIWRYGFNSNMTPDFVPYIYDQMTERPSSSLAHTHARVLAPLIIYKIAGGGED